MMSDIKIANGMIDYQDNWDEFKKWINGEYATLQYFWEDNGGAYIITAVNGMLKQTVGINKSDTPTARQSDFEANFKETASSSLSSGISITMPYPYAYSGEKTRFKGYLYTCTPGTNTFQEKIEDTVKLQAGYYWLKGPSEGDKVSISIVDADNVLGLGAGTVLSQYVTDMYVPPWDHNDKIEANTVASINAGLYIKIVYVNTGASNVKMGITYKWFQS